MIKNKEIKNDNKDKQTTSENIMNMVRLGKGVMNTNVFKGVGEVGEKKKAEKVLYEEDDLVLFTITEETNWYSKNKKINSLLKLIPLFHMHLYYHPLEKWE